MFNSGTNIIVAASSLAKNKSGPRVGSSGFVSESYNMPPPKYMGKELSVLFIPQRVIFTNFGFGTKLRIEEKIIIGILPIPPVNKNFNEEIDKLFTKIYSGDLYHQKWQDVIMNVYNWKCKPICFIVPHTNQKCLINGKDVIFIAWVKTVLKSRYMCAILSEVLSKNSNIFEKKFKLNISVIEILLRLSANAEKFDDKITILLKHYRKETIRTISWLNTINVQHNIATQVKRFKDIFTPRNGQKFDRKRGIETVGKIIFSPLFYKLHTYTKNTERKEVIEFMDNMAVVRAKSANLLL